MAQNLLVHLVHRFGWCTGYVLSFTNSLDPVPTFFVQVIFSLRMQPLVSNVESFKRYINLKKIHYEPQKNKGRSEKRSKRKTVLDRPNGTARRCGCTLGIPRLHP